MKLLPLFFLVLLCSCGSLRKLKTNVKTTEQVKTTEVITTAKDSSTSTVTKQIDSSGTTVTVVFDDNGKDTATNVEITTYPATKEDYNSNRKIGVKTSRTPKSITVNQADKKEDVQQAAAAVKTNDTKAATTDKTTTTKAKNLDKKKSGFVWWFWPLVVVVIIVIALCWYYKITPAYALAWLRKKLTKNNNMKSFILLLTAVLFITSCNWKNDKPTPPRLLEPAVYAEKRVPVRIDTGFRKVPGHFEAGVWVPQQYKFDSLMVVEWATVPIYDWEVVMNGKQTMKYSYLSGYRVKQIIAILLILGLVWLIFNIHIANDHDNMKKAKLKVGKLATGIEVYTRGNAVGWSRAWALIAIFALAFFTLTPARIAQNNAKTITEDQYKHYSGIDPELNYFWDSVFNKGAIDGAKKPKN